LYFIQQDTPKIAKKTIAQQAAASRKQAREIARREKAEIKELASQERASLAAAKKLKDLNRLNSGKMIILISRSCHASIGNSSGCVRF
jgi:hypothetical protein